MGFEGFDFSGTFFVNTDNDDDLIGVVFGYQDFAHFYIVSWKARAEQYFQHACWWVTATGLSVKVSTRDGIIGIVQYLRIEHERVYFLSEN